MREYGIVRKTFGLVAGLLAAMALLSTFSAMAQAGDSLSGREARRAVTLEMFDIQSQSSQSSFGIESCARKGATKFRCRVDSSDDQGVQTSECRLRFIVIKTRGETVASLRGRSCRRNTTPLLTRPEALETALKAGARRAGLPVTIDYLIREERSEFSAQVKWFKTGKTGREECKLAMTVFSARRIYARMDPVTYCVPFSREEQLDQLFQRGPGPKYCPGSAGNTWNAKPELIGRTVAEAQGIAARHGCEVRIVRIDGISQMVTADLRFTRLNVEVEGPDDRITAIAGIF